MKQLDSLEIDGSHIVKFKNKLLEEKKYDDFFINHTFMDFLIKRDVKLFHQHFDFISKCKSIAIVSCEWYITFKLMIEKYTNIVPEIYSNHYISDSKKNVMFDYYDLSLYDLVIIPDFEHFAPVDMMVSNFNTNLLVVNWRHYHYKVNNNLAYSIEDLEELACIKETFSSGSVKTSNDQTYYFVLGNSVSNKMS